MPEFADPWSAEHPPISFAYGDVPAAELLGGWDRQERPLPGPQPGREIAYTDPSTQLRVTARVRRFPEPRSYEWVLEFANAGTSPTPILDQILPLDWRVHADASERIRLHHAKGSSCQPDDFLPLTSDLRQGQELAFAPLGGRSSNGLLPFFNLQRPGSGLVVAIGWSGQWQARFGRGEEWMRLDAGFAVFFRRHESPFPALEVRLRGLAGAGRYAVSTAEGFEAPAEAEQFGRELEALTIGIAQAPGSVLLRYRRVNP